MVHPPTEPASASRSCHGPDEQRLIPLGLGSLTSAPKVRRLREVGCPLRSRESLETAYPFVYCTLGTLAKHDRVRPSESS